MPIRFRCQDCRSRVKVPEGTQGKQVKCPRCGRIQSVPRQNPNGQPEAESLTVHTLVGSMHQSPKRKEALVGAGDNGFDAYESGGGGVLDGLDIPEDAASGDTNDQRHERMSRKQRRRMEARAREAEMAREAAAAREAQECEQASIAESRSRVEDLFATSHHMADTSTESDSHPADEAVGRIATPPKAIALSGGGTPIKHEPATIPVEAPRPATQAYTARSADLDRHKGVPANPDALDPDSRWTFDLTSQAYPFLKVIPWVLRITALMLIGPAFKVMLVADAQGFSGVVSLLVLFMGLALVVVTWTVGEIATAVRDIALRRATG